MANPTKAARRTTYLTGAAALLMTVAVVSFPEAAFEASLDGLQLWFTIVLPALLPFFAMAEILMGLGVIHAVGVLLEPLMRPVFRIPGVGGFAVAMGLASGYPLGAKISGRLRRESLCTQVETERLLSFANTADPLFMIGAVAVGMFGLPEIGLTIALSHYLGVVLVGLIMRFHAGGAMSAPAARSRAPIWRAAARAMADARQRDARPFGELFSDAVKESVNALLFVGGCIIMFSVFLRVMSVAGVTDWIAAPLGLVLGAVGIGPELVAALVKGTVEITIGSQAAAAANADLLLRTAVAGAIIGWSGLSVHAQVAAMVHGTDVRISPYLLARFLHAVIAGSLTFVLFEPLGGSRAVAAVFDLAAFAPPVLALVGASGLLLVFVLALMLLLALCFHAASRVKVVYFRLKP